MNAMVSTGPVALHSKH